MTLWWDKKYGKNSICPITLTRLRPGHNKHGFTRSVFLPCKHGFCRSALVKLVIETLISPEVIPRCPMCRQYFHPFWAFAKKKN